MLHTPISIIKGILPREDSHIHHHHLQQLVFILLQLMAKPHLILIRHNIMVICHHLLLTATTIIHHITNNILHTVIHPTVNIRRDHPGLITELLARVDHLNEQAVAVVEGNQKQLRAAEISRVAVNLVRLKCMDPTHHQCNHHQDHHNHQWGNIQDTCNHSSTHHHMDHLLPMVVNTNSILNTQTHRIAVKHHHNHTTQYHLLTSGDKNRNKLECRKRMYLKTKKCRLGRKKYTRFVWVTNCLVLGSPQNTVLINKLGEQKVWYMVL
mmetsp:Transcript_25251/g.35399  ORF Transcript_25251/g.35399 Transcript_25251/m.35399 type:complete len:267 (+) Transcript_25251:1072-1872(+)